MTTTQAIIPDDIQGAVLAQAGREPIRALVSRTLRAPAALPLPSPSSALREDCIESGFIWHTSGNTNFAWLQHFVHHLAPGGQHWQVSPSPSNMIYTL
jgi:hypothetical protein